MGLIESEAFVLNGFRYGESSKIITLYSSAFGKFNAIVKGVRNVNARHGGVYENMNLINLYFNKKDNRTLQVISKADLICSYNKIKSELDKIAVAYTMLEILNKTSIEYDSSVSTFNLLKNVFDCLDKSKTNYAFILLYYIYKLSFVQGLDFLSFVSHGTFDRESAYKIGNKEIEFLEIFRENDINEISDLMIGKTELRNLSKVLYEFYSSNFHKFDFLKTKDFLNEILHI